MKTKTKTHYYTGLPEARRRLEDSIILYDKEPHYVTRVVYNPGGRAAARREIREGDRTGHGWLVPVADVLAGTPEAREYVWVNIGLGGCVDRGRGDGWNVLDPDQLTRRVLDHHTALRRVEERHPPRAPAAPDEVPPETIELNLIPVAERTDEPLCVKQTDPKLDLTSPRLGMMNGDDGTCVFLERNPVRRSAQGINHANLGIRPLPGLQGLRPERAFDLNFNPALARTMRGEYPAYQEAVEALFGLPGPAGRAFSRDFAVTKEDLELVYLVYRMQKIGWSRDGRTFNLDRNVQFAREQLEQLGVRFNVAA